MQITKEEMRRPTLTTEQIIFWFERFRKLNTNKLKHRRRLIDSFINSVYLYDDRMVITFNYKDGSKTITLEEIENSALGSDLTSLAAPIKRLCPHSEAAVIVPAACILGEQIYESVSLLLVAIRFVAKN